MKFCKGRTTPDDAKGSDFTGNRASRSPHGDCDREKVQHGGLESPKIPLDAGLDPPVEIRYKKTVNKNRPSNV
jgi:hypothetical protein